VGKQWIKSTSKLIKNTDKCNLVRSASKVNKACDNSSININPGYSQIAPNRSLIGTGFISYAGIVVCFTNLKGAYYNSTSGLRNRQRPTSERTAPTTNIINTWRDGVDVSERLITLVPEVVASSTSIESSALPLNNDGIQSFSDRLPPIGQLRRKQPSTTRDPSWNMSIAANTATTTAVNLRGWWIHVRRSIYIPDLYWISRFYRRRLVAKGLLALP
jgi:hypothetical protein